MSRISGKLVDLESAKVREFFERRGESVSEAHPLTSVMYQDDNPRLAETRDAFEKQRVVPLLNISPAAELLDIGCGIGRWADAFVGRVARYHGVDFSRSLIRAAERRFSDPSFTFQVLAAQDVSPAALSVTTPFTHVLISGVLIYLNEADLAVALQSIVACCATGALIYVREPVAIEQRLTLQDHRSEALKSNYSAIYRSELELLEMFDCYVTSQGFRITLNAQLYPDEMNNRSETKQRIFILRRE